MVIVVIIMGSARDDFRDAVVNFIINGAVRNVMFVLKIVVIDVFSCDINSVVKVSCLLIVACGC